MKILIKNRVNQDYKTVFSKFDAELFLALNPPVVPLTLDRFDGSKKGDEIHVTINLLFRKEKWISLVTSDGYSDDSFYFIDEGKKLPFFLKAWRHRHTVKRDIEGSIIIDDVYFKGSNLFYDILLYILFWMQFLYRIPVYKKYFR